MTELSWLRHNLVLGSFYSHQQLMNSMVKIPRQFENILDVGLQGLCPWTSTRGCLQHVPRLPPVFLGSLTMFIKSHKEKSLGSYRHPNSNLVLYIFD